MSFVTCHLSFVIYKAMGHKKVKLKDREKEKKSKIKEDNPPVHGDVRDNHEEEGDDKFPKHLYEEEIAKLQVELVRLQE